MIYNTVRLLGSKFFAACEEFRRAAYGKLTAESPVSRKIPFRETYEDAEKRSKHGAKT